MFLLSHCEYCLKVMNVSKLHNNIVKVPFILVDSFSFLEKRNISFCKEDLSTCIIHKSCTLGKFQIEYIENFRLKEKLNIITK